MRLSRVVALVVMGAAVWAGRGWAQASESQISAELGKLRSVPDAERGARTAAIAKEIQALPVGLKKLQLADGLSHLSTEGDPGRENLQAVATTLAQALNENPVPSKNDKPASPYMDLARLVHYEGMKAEVSDSQFVKALDLLTQDDAEVQQVDFTLKDLNGKKSYTLSQLKGKIVLVNFWATWCPPCRKELPDLDMIGKHFKGQLVILAISDEEMFKVGSYISGNPGFTVLLDPGRKVASMYHVDGIPQTFVYDANGKLVAHGIDMRTQRQFLTMLAKAGMKPE